MADTLSHASSLGPSSANLGVESLTMCLVQELFSNLSDAPFFVKDTELRYVACNAAMLELCGVRDQSEFVGRSARNFFPEPLRDKYENLDRQVMRTRKPVRDQLDLLARLRGRPVWLLYTRWPVEDGQGRIRGIAAVARVLGHGDRRHPMYPRLVLAIEFLRENFRNDVDIRRLAGLCNVSVSQMERDFVALLGLSPRRYLTKLRFEAASALLATTNQAIVTIAHACGYSDQSAFTRRFRDAAGMSPSQYRKLHLKDAQRA